MTKLEKLLFGIGIASALIFGRSDIKIDTNVKNIINLARIYYSPNIPSCLNQCREAIEPKKLYLTCLYGQALWLNA